MCLTADTFVQLGVVNNIFISTLEAIYLIVPEGEGTSLEHFCIEATSRFSSDLYWLEGKYPFLDGPSGGCLL